jgi:ABC-type multidrug transport system ATPase subunit
MIRIAGLTKTFGAFRAVDGVSLEVAAGEIHGFLGPNGAGKTTTIRMVAGLLKPTAGSVTIAGHDLAREPEAAKRALGFIPDRPVLYEKLTSSCASTAGSTIWTARRSRRAQASCSSCSSSAPGATSSSRASPTA